MNKLILSFTTLFYLIEPQALLAMEGQQGENIQPLLNFNVPRCEVNRYAQFREAPNLETLQGINNYREQLASIHHVERKQKKGIIKELKKELARKEIERQELAHRINVVRKEKRIEELKRKLGTYAPVPCTQYSYTSSQQPVAPSGSIPPLPYAFSLSAPQGDIIPPPTPPCGEVKFSEQDLLSGENIISEPSSPPYRMATPEIMQDSEPLFASEQEEEELTSSLYLSDEEIMFSDEDINITDDDNFTPGGLPTEKEQPKKNTKKRKSSYLDVKSYSVNIPKIAYPGPRPFPERKRLIVGFSGTQKSCLNVENVSHFFFKMMAKKKVESTLKSEKKAKNNKEKSSKLKEQNAPFWKKLAHEVRENLLSQKTDSKAYHRLYNFIKRPNFNSIFINSISKSHQEMAILFLSNIGKAFSSLSREYAKEDMLSASEGDVFDKVIEKIYKTCLKGGRLNVNELTAEIIVYMDMQKKKRLKRESTRMKGTPAFSHKSLRGVVQNLKRKNVHGLPENMKELYDEVLRNIYNFCTTHYRQDEKIKKPRKN